MQKWVRNTLDTHIALLKKLQNILAEIQIKDNQSYKDKYCEILVENKLDNEYNLYPTERCES